MTRSALHEAATSFEMMTSLKGPPDFGKAVHLTLGPLWRGSASRGGVCECVDACVGGLIENGLLWRFGIRMREGRLFGGVFGSC